MFMLELTAELLAELLLGWLLTAFVAMFGPPDDGALLN